MFGGQDGEEKGKFRMEWISPWSSTTGQGMNLVETLVAYFDTTNVRESAKSSSSTGTR